MYFISCIFDADQLVGQARIWVGSVEQLTFMGASIHTEILYEWM